MAIEIERKFLVHGSSWKQSASTYLCQGYLNTDKQRTVRIRVAGQKAFLTVKGISTGASRAEFEYEIPLADATQMLELCEQPLIEKNRHLVSHAGLVWEVDEFLGVNQGLVVAEVELQSEEQHVELPSWVAEEVTNDNRYFNSSLSIAPFSTWE